MLNDFYKIGQVIEIRGQKIRIHVFENKNSNILIYKGQIIKNISVGGFVKIPKGFSNIIGRIEGEYIQENILSNSKSSMHFTKESETIDRIIEVTIMGILQNNKFKRGLIDIPLIFSDAYLLTDKEVAKIFEFTPNKDIAICLGSINDYKEEKLYVSSNLFASHIGIFGNTGSGKSNTLAKIYTECFKKFNSKPGFKKSKFLLIDFNGEYTSSFDKNKKVYNLSTRNDSSDKIPISKNFLEDIDMWSIICEATEKTQKPFLNKVISLYKKLYTIENFFSYARKMIENLFLLYFEHPLLFSAHLTYLREIITLIFPNSESAINFLNSIQIRSSKFYMKKISNDNKELWGNNVEEFKINFIQPFLTYLCNEKTTIDDKYILFDFALKYNFLQSLCLGYINEEHISPLISRFNNRLIKIKRLFSICDNVSLKQLSIFSLINVNIEFKKIIPLILCKYYYELQKQSYTEGSLHIIIDEAHNILSTASERESQTWKDYRLETFEEIIKEGRKFRTFLTISSQRPSDISETIISQLHNYFIHRLVNNEDIRAIGKSVSFIDNTSYEMISVLPQGACIFTGISSNFPVLIQIDLLPENEQPQSQTVNLYEMWSKK